ncbi:MAG TPA: hypothetical protein VGR57_20570, partial [Ktedonobacterales bacterium]|nr:hypothetical protein [Ktedonobacterales bacterium]
SDVEKDPNTYKGKTITFTGVTSTWFKDSNGNTIAVNVEDPNDYSSDILIEFTPKFDLTKINKGDTIVVWGKGLGTISGTNAYGGTILVGNVQEVYLNDLTSGYSDTSVTDPSAFAASH